MITKFTARKADCLLDTELALTPFHALIGPNDSGKTTILRGLLALASASSRPLDEALGRDFTFGEGATVTGCTAAGNYVLQRAEAGVEESWVRPQHVEMGRPRAYHRLHPSSPAGNLPWIHDVAKMIGTAALVDFDPPALRAASSLLPDSSHSDFLALRGAGLPGIYDSINNRGDDAFRKISERLSALFPAVKRLRLNTVSPSQKEIMVELKSGELVGAAHVSEGILYFLAYTSLLYIRPVSMLLIEEPETGLHPARIAEVIRTLRAVSESGVQIVLATHSPLVVGEMKPEEVSIVTRTVELGTKAVCIKDTPHFEERAKVMALGEIWLNYSDGIEEAGLIKGTVP